jgi:hypothetical protein
MKLISNKHNINITKYKNNLYPYDIKGKDININPSQKEWTNVNYSFSQKNLNNNTKSIDFNVYKLITSYFNMYKKEMKKKIGIFTKGKNLFSGNKVWISKPEIKQTNDTVSIDIYIYNRKINVLIKNIKYKYLSFLKKKRNFIVQYKNFFNRFKPIIT